MSKLIGAGIELRVAQLFSCKNQCRGIRRGQHLRLDQAVQTVLAREIGSRGVPVTNNLLLFMIRQQRQLANRRLRITRQRLQNLPQMRRQLRHVQLAERLTGVAESHRQRFAQVDHQRQRVMSLLLRVQAAEHQPLRCGLL
ncbi:hypothetical protein BV330_05239 [Pseudomonas syringae pv. actinidiae]|nr:hypothetical protein BV339_05211 [Pseudomonas syringae pv. actinidiae]OSN15092.1 hypothetical protein BV341_05366 [Pseudomonas syringae pv. actinidiae]OSN29523.1 hypothetical protein BV343_05186 [Pseudomonas syringae pv. actinidiae]OSN29636.1 hypothetical protein BV342_05411 [Pseudomonas syringae pv. actinidiae]OSN36309.1 hypothetical protein BV344_05203 [Pseudomonas syringae pv. actinidiae]